MKHKLLSASLLVAGLVVGAPAQSTSLPHFISKGSISVAGFDGRTLRDPRPNEDPPFPGYPDDLLSGGLNADGLQSASPPPFADPLNPTRTDLRRYALWTNFRAITDMTTAGGYGLFWGPGLAPDFPDVAKGLIPGVEYKALIKRSGSRKVNNVPVAVQIPDNFDVHEPCMLLAPPSGSRGNYGGIAVGEWGLFRGCAVVLPGKATGTGFHLLETDEVYDRDGVLTPAADVGRQAQFAVKSSRRLEAFIEAHPDRVATKHAHSQINPERLWGSFALQGIRFAFWALNDRYAEAQNHNRRDWRRRDDDSDSDNDRDEDKDEEDDATRFTPANTLVIASGTSNGAGASLRALERDHERLIDGLVVLEPNINPDSAGKFVIRFGSDEFAGHGTSLYDNHTLMSIYAACAALSPSLAGTPFNFDPLGAPAGSRANRCGALKAAGMLSADTLDEQADESLQVLRANGYYEEQDTLLAAHEWLNLWRALNPTYAAAHGRFAVWDNVCGISYAATDLAGSPTPVPRETAARLFSTSGGIPPTGGINLVNDEAANGPILENLTQTADGIEELNLDGARCFRYLAIGDSSLLDGGTDARDRRRFRRVQRGIRQTLTSGDLHGTPAMILTGRSDALVFPNYHSRPYYGLNQLVEGDDSRLSYVEVVNAQHFEAFISTLWLDPVAGAQFVPLHFYLFQALDTMYAFLMGERDALPPSQVVRPKPRGVNPYAKLDEGSELLPNLENDPDDSDRIRFANGVLQIPE